MTLALLLRLRRSCANRNLVSRQTELAMSRPIGLSDARDATAVAARLSRAQSCNKSDNNQQATLVEQAY
jgi:hypothetical protein